MPSPQIINLNYSYKKFFKSLCVLDINNLPIDNSLISEKKIVYLAPKAVGGDHAHAHTEWFIGFGELLFVWFDDNGYKHEEQMNPNNQLKLIVVPAYLKHSIVNYSTSNFAIVFEMSDRRQNLS